MQDNYRKSLRELTQTDHLMVDEAISGLDISKPSDLAQFLSIHLTCFHAMARASQDAATIARLDAMTSRIERDLETLGQPAQPVPASPSGRLDPLALDYVLEGSRLGTQVLKRRWAASTDPTVQRADAYFTLHADKLRWRATCDALAAVDPESPRASRITGDTRALFQLFYRASQDAALSARAYSKVL